MPCFCSPFWWLSERQSVINNRSRGLTVSAP
nr:MAG TPA: hypothetical protein [Caudoviricetes sp.]